MDDGEIKTGDCLEVMKEMPNNSIDFICTDPPYGMGFMGKAWDKALPSVEIWKECLRILKDGAFMVVMSIPRSDCLSRMIIKIEDAGFRVDFTPIYWAYASGFPKANNIGKMVDKRNGRDGDKFIKLGEYLKAQRDILKVKMKTIQEKFLSKTGGLTGCVSNWELGLNVPTKKQYEILKQILDLDSRFDKLIKREEAEREIIGKSKYADIDRTKNKWIGKNNHIWETAPSTNTAKKLNGSYGGFQPKPAVEVIIVAMKPLSEKTYVDQAMKNGKGITWLDRCRIPYESEEDKESSKPQGKTLKKKGWDNKKWLEETKEANTQGRFPANLLVSHNAVDTGEIKKSGHMDSIKNGDANVYGKYGSIETKAEGDSGDFSRYFDLDSWECQFIVTPKAAKGEKNKGCDGKGQKSNDGRKIDADNTFQRGATLRQNHHPTVKPVKLMAYLIEMFSQIGDIILDPFAGSGTTGVAARKRKRKFVLIDKEKEYTEICESRINKTWPDPEQLNLFEMGEQAE